MTQRIHCISCRASRKKMVRTGLSNRGPNSGESREAHRDASKSKLAHHEEGRLCGGKLSSRAAHMKRLMRRGSGQDEPSSVTDEDARVRELRTALEPLSEGDRQFVTDACLRRYLRARSWNFRKAEKMIRDTLAWRASYKPEDIHWEDVAKEAETGKVYRAATVDKQGRPVLVMRPSKQNTTSREGQVKQLVYSMENAIANLPEDQEEMIWLVDFKNWSLTKPISIKTTQDAAHVLQRHYPERLGYGILLNPPHIFEAFWQVVKRFLDAKTVRKVKFVYSNDSASMKLVDELFDAAQLEELLKDDNFNLEEYSNQMRQDDSKFHFHRKLADANK